MEDFCDFCWRRYPKKTSFILEEITISQLLFPLFFLIFNSKIIKFASVVSDLMALLFMAWLFFTLWRSFEYLIPKLFSEWHPVWTLWETYIHHGLLNLISKLEILLKFNHKSFSLCFTFGGMGYYLMYILYKIEISLLYLLFRDQI